MTGLRALTGPNPVDRGEPGSKIHVLCDRRGIPLQVLISAANTPDAQVLFPLLDAFTPVRGRPRHRLEKLHADKAYDQQAIRAEVERRGIRVRIARNGIESSQRLGRHRWVVESCLSWFTDNRRLVRRYDRKPNTAKPSPTQVVMIRGDSGSPGQSEVFRDLGGALATARRSSRC